MATVDQANWIARVLDYKGSADERARSNGSAMAGWHVARTTALASLKALEGAFRGMKRPEVDSAIVLLRAIQANLTAEPATAAQVSELESYLTQDRIIRDAERPNGFGFKVELRAPLLKALAGLRAEQATAGGAGS